MKEIVLYHLQQTVALWDVFSESYKYSPSEWTLPLHLALWGWIRCKKLFTYLFIIMWSYFSYHVLSSHVNSTHATRKFETGFLKLCHCQMEVNIKNQLPQNCSLFTSACPSKIQWSHLEKMATSSYLYGGL